MVDYYIKCDICLCVCAYIDIPYMHIIEHNNKKEWSINTYNILNESSDNYEKWKKPIPKVASYIITYMHVYFITYINIYVYVNIFTKMKSYLNSNYVKKKMNMALCN